MLCLKIMRGSELVAAEAHEDPVYVRRQHNGLIVRCAEPSAQGILSLDGSTNYQLIRRDPLGDTELTAEPIYETDYEELVAQLEEQETQNAEANDPDPEQDDKMTVQQMRDKITELEGTVESMQSTNDMLIECILEMSEAVYG